jgi:hypothetical protein
MQAKDFKLDGGFEQQAIVLTLSLTLSAHSHCSLFLMREDCAGNSKQDMLYLIVYRLRSGLDSNEE